MTDTKQKPEGWVFATALAMLKAGNDLAAAATNVHPTSPSSASITRLRAAVDAWDSAIARTTGGQS